MKRLILKFKHWLIKKLGGYTEQQVDNRRIIVHSHQFQPMILRGEVGASMYADSRMPFDAIKSALANQLADEIIKNKLCNIECRDDPELLRRVYRAELFLIHPHDASMCFLTEREKNG